MRSTTALQCEVDSVEQFDCRRIDRCRHLMLGVVLSGAIYSRATSCSFGRLLSAAAMKIAKQVDLDATSTDGEAGMHLWRSHLGFRGRSHHVRKWLMIKRTCKRLMTLNFLNIQPTVAKSRKRFYVSPRNVTIYLKYGGRSLWTLDCNTELSEALTGRSNITTRSFSVTA